MVILLIKRLSLKLVDTTKAIQHILIALNKDDYTHFKNELVAGEQADLKDFEKESANFFEACFIEEIARRGIDTMRYGPLKSIGLWNPKWGDL